MIGVVKELRWDVDVVDALPEGAEVLLRFFLVQDGFGSGFKQIQAFFLKRGRKFKDIADLCSLVEEFVSTGEDGQRFLQALPPCFADVELADGFPEGGYLPFLFVVGSFPFLPIGGTQGSVDDFSLGFFVFVELGIDGHSGALGPVKLAGFLFESAEEVPKAADAAGSLKEAFADGTSAFEDVFSSFAEGAMVHAEHHGKAVFIDIVQDGLQEIVTGLAVWIEKRVLPSLAANQDVFVAGGIFDGGLDAQVACCVEVDIRALVGEAVEKVCNSAEDCAFTGFVQSIENVEGTIVGEGELIVCEVAKGGKCQLAKSHDRTHPPPSGVREAIPPLAGGVQRGSECCLSKSRLLRKAREAGLFLRL